MEGGGDPLAVGSTDAFDRRADGGSFQHRHCLGELAPRGGQDREDLPAVGVEPAALDESPLLEPIDQVGDRRGRQAELLAQLAQRLGLLRQASQGADLGQRQLGRMPDTSL